MSKKILLILSLTMSVSAFAKINTKPTTKPAIIHKANLSEHEIACLALTSTLPTQKICMEDKSIAPEVIFGCFVGSSNTVAEALCLKAKDLNLFDSCYNKTDTSSKEQICYATRGYTIDIRNNFEEIFEAIIGFPIKLDSLSEGYVFDWDNIDTDALIEDSKRYQELLQEQGSILKEDPI